MLRSQFALIVLFLLPRSGEAHFNVILPADYDTWSSRRGEEVHFRFVWGHGYEHLWMDATKPASLVAWGPMNERIDLTGLLENTVVPTLLGPAAKAFQFRFAPPARGDWVLALEASLIWDEEEGVWLKDYARSTLHVQQKGGWERRLGTPIELVPLTRPYGLHVGSVFRAQAVFDGKPLPDQVVELEKLQPMVPDETRIPDETFITFEAMTDANGVVSFGMHEEGWFGLTTAVPGAGEYEEGGHRGPVLQRATLWVHVSPLMAVPR